jgi:hypothetical protein
MDAVSTTWVFYLETLARKTPGLVDGSRCIDIVG